MLTFMATTEQKEERTLWIDDVRVSEEPDPNPAALLNEATIPHEALQHRLRAGDQLEFTVDPMRRLGPRDQPSGRRIIPSGLRLDGSALQQKG